MRCGLLYALNPLPVLVTAYHGQVEEIPVLGGMLALLLLLGRSRWGWALSALCLGLAVAYKTWPLLFLLPLLLLVQGWWRRFIYALLTLMPLTVSWAVYEAAFRGRALSDLLGTGNVAGKIAAFMTTDHGPGTPYRAAAPGQRAGVQAVRSRAPLTGCGALDAPSLSPCHDGPCATSAFSCPRCALPSWQRR